ncbi:SH3 domain-containing protein [Frigidibacter sp. ROC022]|uniref:SH3 domain-containing protein n=1 Tax=Frigidibacter sp. ROC022 TaxID=2971796 RepID=UPI00215A2675|nr:SH3 domain-containing protein [Frigidibacter sp. ROC022]MCR8722885.1 SH3 domain-containing protein [Frigidibacter sp. ROC022]
MKRGLQAAIGVIAALFLAVSATASTKPPTERGPVTNLPIPRFVSLKTSVGNARRGPSTAHRIDWVFTRKDMPLEVIGEYGHWRQVRDRDGATGWVHYSLLSGSRTVIIERDLAALRMKPEDDAPATARVEAGVVARLGKCTLDWCRVTADGYKGWLRKTALWGVMPDETRD